MSERCHIETIVSVLRHCVEESERLVAVLYPDILKVAAVLMEREVLTSKQIKTLLAKPRRKKPIRLRASSLMPASCPLQNEGLTACRRL